MKPKTESSVTASAAVVFAALANVPATGWPSERERARQLAAWCRLTRTPRASVESWMFDLVQRRAAQWIGALLKGGAVRPGGDAGAVLWRLDGDRLLDDYPQANEHLLGELVALLHQRPFPFRLCRQCGRIFARRGKLLVCDDACRRSYLAATDTTAAERQRRSRARRRRAARAAAAGIAPERVGTIRRRRP